MGNKKYNLKETTKKKKKAKRSAIKINNRYGQ